MLRLLECFEIFLNLYVKESIKDKRGKEKDESSFKKNRKKKRKKNLASGHNFLYVLVQYILLRTKLLLTGPFNFERAVINVKKKEKRSLGTFFGVSMFGCLSFYQG